MPRGKLAERLATGKYNVVVAGILDQADRKTLDAFLAQGGGVLICNPENSGDMTNWPATNEWLAAYGARPRWEVLHDDDAANVAVDVMGCRLSWSNQVSAPVNDGVRGVLTLTWGGTTGCEPPMSLDLTPDWTAVVRGAHSLHGVKEVRNDEQLQAWLPKELAGPSPALMAVRDSGQRPAGGGGHPQRLALHSATQLPHRGSHAHRRRRRQKQRLAARLRQCLHTGWPRPRWPRGRAVRPPRTPSSTRRCRSGKRAAVGLDEAGSAAG